MKKNIILIGFMGCGKSSVGELLHKAFAYTFIDTDQTIEKDSGTTIRDIFAQKGEAYFRELETKTIEKMAESTEHAVISTGGGLPLRECNAKILKEMGFVVYLRVKGETVLKRLEGDITRPLLQGDNVEEKVKSLMEYRDPIYEVSAHLVLDVDDKDFDSIIDEIKRNYEIMVSR
ncbi:shikimate kinase [Anaeromicropila populeti]|uniref:Shikimate kinase n=1 Tax=Anaeromicropila populeti TaxID=37658 RepID=A0A1I6KWU4_9FIRM|nr:shikimate kinase [Anaeromicropila populeti]SFR95410.1 shikimate kinase [Anaeromicropila populeti]